jgi:PAS domain S-box-containing protein
VTGAALNVARAGHGPVPRLTPAHLSLSRLGVARATGGLSIAMGVAGLFGWFFDVHALTSFAPGLPGMRPNSAIVLVLLGLTLVFRGRRSFSVLGPVTVATLSILTLIEYAGPPLGIDALLFRAHGSTVPGPILATTDAAFLLLACALLLVRRGGTAARTAQPFALVAGALAWLAITGYANGVSGLYKFPAVSAPIALNTAIALIAVVVGVLALRPDEGLVRLVMSRMAGGWLLRVLGPIAILAPTLLAWLSHIGEANGLYGNEVGTLLLVFVLVLVLLGALGIVASAVERSVLEHAGAVAAELKGAFILPFVDGVKDHAIVGFDTAGHVIHWNAGAERLYGYTKEEIVGAAISAFYPPEADESAPEKELARVMASGFDHVEGLRLRKDGAQFLADISITAIRDEAGQLVGFTKVARDITEDRRAEAARVEAVEELRQRTADLSAANEELEAFAYSVSHDLRAPLRGIDGFSQAVLEEYSDRLDDKGKDYLIRLRSASQRMGLLIDDILNLSRISRVEPGHERVDLSAIATSTAADMREREPDRQVEFVIEEGVMARGDSRFLSIVFENLYANALKFTSTHAHARIEFGCEQTDGESVYFVRDDGVGFDMAYSDQLFVPFHRLHTQTDFPGSGIGLATIRRIVRRHGGRTWAHGEVDRGATVYFTLGDLHE